MNRTHPLSMDSSDYSAPSGRMLKFRTILSNVLIPLPAHAPGIPEWLAYLAVTALIVFIDWKGGVRFTPGPLYHFLVIYTGWRWRTRHALAALSITSLIRILSEVGDAEFISNIWWQIDVLTRIVGEIVILVIIVGIRRSTLEIISLKREHADFQRMFVATVSHEFRTPIAIVNGHAQNILNDRPRTDENTNLRARKILDATQQLSGLVDRILLSEQIGHGQLRYHPVAIDLVAVINAAVSSFKETNSRCTIGASLGALPPVIEADPSLLKHVIDNLLQNAVAYSEGPAEISLNGATDGDSAVITVKDHGRGIDPADLPHIFKRYFRGKNSTTTPGTGIGLHLVHSIVAQHRGSIAVESRVGAGTAFTVRLPIQNAQA